MPGGSLLILRMSGLGAQVPSTWYSIGKPLAVPARDQLVGAVPFIIDDTGRYLYSHDCRWDLKTGRAKAYGLFTAPDPAKTQRNYRLAWNENRPPNISGQGFRGLTSWEEGGFDDWIYCRGKTLGLYIGASIINGQPSIYFAGKIGGTIWPGKAPLPPRMWLGVPKLMTDPPTPTYARLKPDYKLVYAGRTLRIRAPRWQGEQLWLAPEMLIQGGTYMKQGWMYLDYESNPCRSVCRLVFGSGAPRIEKVSDLLVSSPVHRRTYFALCDGRLIRSDWRGHFDQADGRSAGETSVYSPSPKRWRSYPGVWVRAGSLNGKFVAYSVYPWNHIQVAKVISP